MTALCATIYCGNRPTLQVLAMSNNLALSEVMEVRCSTVSRTVNLRGEDGARTREIDFSTL